MKNSLIEIAVLLVAIFSFWILSRRFYRWRMYLLRNTFLRLILIFISGYFFGIIGMYLLEHSMNPNFSSLYQTFWVVTFYILGGLRGTLPKTGGGRIISVFLLLIGVGMVGMVVGKVVEIILRKEVKMPNNVKEHFVICNWNKKGERIVRELHSPLAAPNVPIIVLTEARPENEEVLRSAYPDEFSNVEFRLGDPTQYEVLRHARVDTADGVMILSDYNASDPDAKSVMVALAINGVCKNIGRRPYIVAESVNHRKVNHLKEAGVDEVICATDYGIGILVQSLLYSKLSEVYRQLLTYSEDTNEFYELSFGEIMKAVDGKVTIKDKSFRYIMGLFNRHRNSKNPIIVIGIKRKGKIILNPRVNDGTDVFKEGNGLIVMAYKHPTIEEIKAVLEGG